ncbi:MAG: phage major capsid protein [Bacilli bacterium]|nr:phage major capsid protein [Bacilli bacterium]
MNERKGLEEKRNDLEKEMKELVANSKKENRAMNDDEVAKFDENEKAIKEIDATLERMDKVNNMEEKEEKREEETEKTLTTEEKRFYKSVEERDDTKAFATYIRNRVAGIETRDGEVNLTKGANGGVIPQTIVNKIWEKVEEISPIHRLATKYNIKGTAIIPKEDESEGEITVAFQKEFDELTSKSNKFGTISLGGYLYGALTKISKSLLNNTDFNLTNWVIKKMAKKIARFLENVDINGYTNTDAEVDVKGVAGSYDATNMTVTLASKSAITADELIDIQELIPDVYQEGCAWYMKKATRTAIRKLKDGDGNYLMQRDFTQKGRYVLLGAPVYLSDNIKALGTAKENVIYYGDMSGLAVKESETPEIQVLVEKFATQHAIGVVAWGEIDAKVENTQKIAVAKTPNA